MIIPNLGYTVVAVGIGISRWTNVLEDQGSMLKLKRKENGYLD